MSKKAKGASAKSALAPAAKVQPGFISRGRVLLLTAVLALLMACLLAGGNFPLLLLEWLKNGHVLALWLLSASGLGWGLLALFSWMFKKSASDIQMPALPLSLRMATAVGLGMGLQGLVVLGCWMYLSGPQMASPTPADVGFNAARSFCVWMTMPGAIAFVYLAKGHMKATRSWLTQPAGSLRLMMPLAVPVGVMMFGCVLPPVFLWGDDPHSYDVLSYHFQLPREWLETGSMAPVSHSAFSYFPLLAETHFLWAFAIRNVNESGMFLAQMTSMAHALIGLLAVYGTARLLMNSLAAMVAVLLAAYVPWTAMLGSVGYVESHLMLYATLSLGLTLAGLMNARGTISFFAAAGGGSMAGLAAGAKLTAFPVLMLCWPIAVLVTGPKQVKKLLIPACVFGLAALLFYSPWAIRTAAYSGGNPVYPLAQSTLGGPMSPQQQERWNAAHAAPADRQSLQGRALSFWQALLANDRFGFVIWPMAALGAWLTWRQSSVVRALAIFILLQVILWLFASHLQGRFLVTCIAPACLLAAMLMMKPGYRAVGVSVVMLACAIGAVVLMTRMTTAISASWRLPVVGMSDLRFAIAQEFEPALPVAMSGAVQVAEKSNQVLVLAGDVRPFLFPTSAGTIRYRTVFDAAHGDVLAALAGTDWQQDAAAGKQVLFLIHPQELQRLARTYKHLTMNPKLENRPPFITDIQGFKALTDQP